MTYSIEFKPRAIRDLKGIDKTVARCVVEKIELLKYDLASAMSCYRTASGSERDKESALANVALDPLTTVRGSVSGRRLPSPIRN